jgi:hypothetical protein
MRIERRALKNKFGRFCCRLAIFLQAQAILQKNGSGEFAPKKHLFSVVEENYFIAKAG